MKKVVALILTFVFCLSVLPSNFSLASQTNTVSLSKVSAIQGQSVAVEMRVERNTGIAGLIVSIGFDEEVFTLTDVVNGGLFDTVTNKKNIVFSNSSGMNSSEDGLLATLTFSVEDAAELNEYPITITIHECTDEELNDVACTVEFGSITVECAHKNVEEIAGTAPTCLQVGLTAGFRCSACGSWLVPQEEIPALGHEYTGQIIRPTCTEQGYTKYVCIRGDDEYYDDYVDPIPHDFSILQADAEQHWFECSYGCGVTSEKTTHYGGIATCADPAYCIDCGTSYGELAPNNHAGGTYLVGQKEATHFEAGYTGDVYCSGCDMLLENGSVIEKTDHIPASDWSTDSEYHWKECTLGCGTQLEKEKHIGGSATCTAKAKCSECNAEYGDVLGHSYTVLKSDDEYHWYECANGCGSISGKETHSGGAATCTAKAKCSVCNAEYGDVLGHSYTVLKSDNEYHWYECANGCGSIIGKEKHSGGQATCTTKAKCSVCETEYGDILGHSFTVLKSDGEYHWYECANGCGSISGKEKHSGGAATCTTKAKCSVCNAEYGDVLGHSYTILKSDGEYHWYECANGCGTIIGKEKHSGGAATCTAKAKCSVCNAEYGDVLGQSYTVLKSDGEYHWYECANGCGSISGKEKHSGGAATCTEEAKCSVCGTEYGEALGHSYTVLKSDGEYHWYECANGCGTISGKVKHTGGTATCTGKAKCSICGTEYGSTLDHSYTVLKSDGEYHWYECANGCGTISGKVKHTGGAATCTEKAKCSVCNAEYGNTLNHSYTVLKSDKEYHWYECANKCGSTNGKQKHTYGKWITDTPSTYTTEGFEYRECSVCKYKETKSLPKEELDVLFGDVNHDGRVTSADARLALRRAVELEHYEKGSYEFFVSDVNFDGKVTSADARLILRAAVALEDPTQWLVYYQTYILKA